jgi:hypothetical protein
VLIRCLYLHYSIAPSKAITQLSWRQPRLPLTAKGNDGGREADAALTAAKFKLAVASEDNSLRVYSISDLGS